MTLELELHIDDRASLRRHGFCSLVLSNRTKVALYKTIVRPVLYYYVETLELEYHSTITHANL